jgi:DNA-binding beta-propeller fold protein YncE
MKPMLIGLILFLASWADAQEPVLPLKLEKTIPLDHVKGRIDHLAIDLQGQRLFVAALGNDTVDVIDLKAGKRTQTLSGFSEPQGIFYVREFDKLFIANGSDGTCRILDGHSFKTTGTVELGSDADNVRYDEKAKRIYVGYGDGALAAIDAKTGAKVADIKLAAHPESFRLETNGMRIFVNVPGADQIAVVDREKKAVIKTWPLKEAKSNFPMILDEPNHRLFVGCRHPSRLLAVDTANGKTVDSVEISGDTDDLFYDAARKQIYVSCGAGSLDVVKIDGLNKLQTPERIPTVSGARTSFFSPEHDELYLAVRAGLVSGGAVIRVYNPR